MLFSEIYSSYFQTVAQLLREAVRQPLTEQRLLEIVRANAFGESVLSIPDAVRGEWQLLCSGGTTPLRHPPTMPLSTLQRRWLKALTLDPRIRLFAPPLAGLEDVEPLFAPSMFCWYDRYGDGDDYANEAYQQNFRLILQALRQKRRLWLEFCGGRGKFHQCSCVPLHLEYSSKDDKFRLLAIAFNRQLTINLARIRRCRLKGTQQAEQVCVPAPPAAILVLEITDERNALERVLLHFSHLQKEAEQLSPQRYRLTLHYEQEDEKDMLIRVLSFGPLVKVIEPQDFAGKIRNRLRKQAEYLNR